MYGEGERYCGGVTSRGGFLMKYLQIFLEVENLFQFLLRAKFKI